MNLTVSQALVLITVMVALLIVSVMICVKNMVIAVKTTMKFVALQPQKLENKESNTDKMVLHQDVKIYVALVIKKLVVCVFPNVLQMVIAVQTTKNGVALTIILHQMMVLMMVLHQTMVLMMVKKRKKVLLDLVTEIVAVVPMIVTVTNTVLTLVIAVKTFMHCVGLVTNTVANLTQMNVLVLKNV